MASFRDQLNAYGQQNDPAMSRHGNYADLPNPKRAEEIVTEARQRLAASGGKASMLPQMIQRVSAEFAQRDEMQNTGGGDRSPDYVQPNNIDNYIDRVLQMGGMTGNSNAAAAGDGASAGMDESDDTDTGVQLPSGENAPVPTARPEVPEEDGNDGWSFGQMAAGLLGMGGVAALARHLYNQYGQKAGQAVDSAGNAISEAADGAQKQLAGPASNVDQTIADIDGNDADGGQRTVTETKQGRLPAPTNAVDESIDKTMSEEDFDKRFGEFVEGNDSNMRPGPNRFSGQQNGQGDPAIASAVDEATELANSGDVRGAVNRLREAGVEIDDNLMRTLAEASNTFKSLKTRAGNVAGDVVGGAARRAVR